MTKLTAAPFYPFALIAELLGKWNTNDPVDLILNVISVDQFSYYSNCHMFRIHKCGGFCFRIPCLFSYLFVVLLTAFAYRMMII